MVLAEEDRADHRVDTVQLAQCRARGGDVVMDTYIGTAPVEFFSGVRIAHRLSRRRNRTSNAAIRMAAITQLRHTYSEGRTYFERKVAEGKTNPETLRSLKRHLSNAIYQQLVADAPRQPVIIKRPGRARRNDYKPA